MVRREHKILKFCPKGRTSTILNLVKNLYGRSYRVNIEEIYASDSKDYYENYKSYWVDRAKTDLKRRGSYKRPSKYDLMFSIIRNFPKVKTLDTAPFKILIIYEADKLERFIQQALRRTMEKYYKICRFILVAESVSNIIDPIRSRCVKLKFFPLNKKDFLGKIKYIGESEGLEINNDALSLIFYYSSGDMSVAIDLVQAAGVYSRIITGNLIYDIVKRMSPSELTESLQLAIGGNIVEARDNLRKLFSDKKYTGRMILRLFHLFLINSPISEKTKEKISIRISDFDYNLSNPCVKT